MAPMGKCYICGKPVRQQAVYELSVCAEHIAPIGHLQVLTPPAQPTAPTDDEARKAIKTLIAWIGDDPNREGLQDTPDRVMRAWRNDWGKGYQDPGSDLVRLFENTDHPYNSMIVLPGIQVYSCCEHHLAPFFGTAVVGYIPEPDRGIVGISKLARIVDHFSRRLQVQERLTEQVASYLAEHVSKDCGVIIRCTHLCMVSRGVRQPNASTVTSSLRGAFFGNELARAEFLRLYGTAV